MKCEEMGTFVINATDINDAWFTAIENIFDKGYDYRIDHGSYEGQWRLEYDHVVLNIKFPNTRPLAPEIPAGLGIPPPTTDENIEEYFVKYLMSDNKEPNEDYTYAERLVNPKFRFKKDTEINLLGEGDSVKINDEIEVVSNLSQIESVIQMYKDKGHGTNQAVMEIGMPSDIKLADPPCLRLIDTLSKSDSLK